MTASPGDAARPRPVPTTGVGPTPHPEPGAPPRPPPADPAPPASPAPAPTAPAAADTRELDQALHRLRTVVAGAAFPLDLPDAEAARATTLAVVDQLDDYLLPRLRRLDAPLLVVVGGSTGAGKSTLVNSLVGATVSTAGVLRPTTRSPVLVCHPADEAWFRGGELLPGLTRTPRATAEPHTLHLRADPAVPAGLALLDAPDVDSVVDANRALARQLLAAADLWLFVTTAARYADAVPWGLLRTAVSRGTATALVLDRVPAEAAGEIATHLREMLDERALDQAPLFVLAEAEVDHEGLLPESETRALRQWLTALAADADTRGAVARQSLDGAVAALDRPLAELAAAADAQTAAVAELTSQLDAARAAATEGIAHGLRDGTLLRGEVLARWQEFVGTGDLMRAMEARVSRLRDRIAAAVTGRPRPEQDLRGALQASLADLLREAVAAAVEQARRRWRDHPAGATLLDAGRDRPAPGVGDRVDRLVRDWQRGVLELVRGEGTDKRARARGAAYAVNATSLAVMVAVFASTAFVPTGVEIAAGAGSAVAGQKILEAIFGDQAIRRLATTARRDLLERADRLVGGELAHIAERLAARPVADSGPRLRAAAAAVAEARAALALVDQPTPLPRVAGAE